MTEEKIKVSDRVKRSNGESCVGTVKEIRFESTAAKSENKEKNPIIGVQWDNGTYSFFTPEALHVTKGG